MVHNTTKISRNNHFGLSNIIFWQMGREMKYSFKTYDYSTNNVCIVTYSFFNYFVKQKKMA